MMKDRYPGRLGYPWDPRGRRWDVLCLASLVSIVGCASEHTAESGRDSDPGTAAAVPVRVAQAQRITLHPSIDLVGTLVAIPERTAVIAPQIEGRIERVSVVEGTHVKSGQILVQLDPRPAEAQRQRAEALVARQQAVLDRLKHGRRPQEIEIAKQDAQQAKAELESLRLRVDATAKLYENNEVSDVEFKKLKSMLRRNEAAYAAAAARLDLYQVGTRPEAIAEAHSQLDVARADLVRARLAVDFCRITSPLDGVVTQLSVRRGVSVAPSDRLATVVDLSQIFVRVRVPSGYLSNIKRGARTEVDIPSLPNEQPEGEIFRFSGEADANTGDMQAYAVLPNREGHLKPGLGCRARVWLPPIEHALVVPVSAVADRGGTSVLHVVRNHKAYEVEVGLGADTREYVQITAGLSPGDVVITEGGYGLPKGCPVRIRSR